MIEANLKYVRIYFDTPTFDRITKDRAAKFVDMLSAIGGTMGLLTGFSIISGVEILYFAMKIMLWYVHSAMLPCDVVPMCWWCRLLVRLVPGLAVSG